VLEALRATLFHAYDGNWTAPTLRLAAMGMIVIVAGMLIGRWRPVSDETYGPAVDV
jgi:putative membrane protein